MNWSVEKTDTNVHVIRIPYSSGEWHQDVLLSADRHHDNPQTNWKLERKHLEEAKKRGAPIVDVGDLFCAMQGRNDRRRSKGDIRPCHQGENYLDLLVEEASEFYGPYDANFAVLARGNHDNSIRKNLETDLLRRLAYRLGIELGGYRGWIRFMFERESGGGRQSVWLYYTHGAGGGGPVTKGVIKTNRRAVYTPDAEIIVSGHIHESWVVEIPRFRVTDGGKQYRDTQYHVQIPTYKDEFSDLGEGWANERESPPKPMGAWWIRFYREGGRVKMKFIRAD